MHHVQDAPTPTLVMRSGHSHATCPDVVDYAGPTGCKLDLRDFTRDTCSNCSLNPQHPMYGKKKLSDGELTHLRVCYSCYATLGCVTAAVRWNHVFDMPEQNVHHIGGHDLTPSEQFLSSKNQNLKCQGCRNKGCATRMYKCTSKSCTDFLCSRCIPFARGKHTFGHVFSVWKPHDEYANVVQ